MKNPIDIHKQHSEKINEIFGKIARFFSPKKTTPDHYITKIGNKETSIPIKLSSSEKKKFEKNAEVEYLAKIEKARQQNLDPNSDFGGKCSNPKGVYHKVRLLPSGGVSIDGYKNIEDFKELFIENVSRGKGMGTFRKISVRDFVCYDVDNDPYGIAWLFERDASYDAEKITGKLFYNKYNQSVNFTGQWYDGKFYGRIAGSKFVNAGKGASKNIIQKKYNSIKNLILQTINNFESKFGIINNQEIKNKIIKFEKNKNLDKNQQKLLETLKNSFPEFIKIRRYLETVPKKQGVGTSSYVKSPELYAIKSMIDNNEDNDVIQVKIDQLQKDFKIIDSKINKFYTTYNQIQSINTPSQPSSGTTPAKKIKI